MKKKATKQKNYRDKWKPYIRLYTGNEYAETFRVAIKLAACHMMLKDGKYRKVYVMVQRGFPNACIAAGSSRRECYENILTIAFGERNFNGWARYTMLYAQDHSSFKGDPRLIARPRKHRKVSYRPLFRKPMTKNTVTKFITKIKKVA